MTQPVRPPRHFTRRQALEAGLGAGAAFSLPLLPAWAQHHETVTTKSDQIVDLHIGETAFSTNGRTGKAVTVNGTLPGPLLRFKQGETVTLRVTNQLAHDTSIHWHGILLPTNMDGVPGLSFDGIKPGETFEYHYTLKQHGTYWYHSHSGLQEQSGLYGPLIIDPAGDDPVAYDHEHVILLSDWTFTDPHTIFAKLKKASDYYNRQRPTVGGFFKQARDAGFGAALKDRMAWGAMRMTPSDIADVSAPEYTYLMNGHDAGANWTGLFAPGERVRLRIINGSAMTYFNVRIPGLALTVVQADGQDIVPVTVDEFQIGIAETYDVIVTPTSNDAYTIMAESMDRSSFVRGTLAPQIGMSAPVPPLRKPPKRTMADMGMDHGDMAMGEMGAMGETPDMDMGMDHAAMGHGDMAMPATPNLKTGPGVANVAAMTSSRLDEPGTGLNDVGHRVLTYSDLKSLTPRPHRTPDRELELHLTGNMERYMWSFDGKKFSEVKAPIMFHHGERVRLTFVNNTMMEHPLHLHGLWMELDNGHGGHIPRKHTISIKPTERVSVEVNADAMGDWAMHCHLLYHMEAGMFRAVRVAHHDMAALK